MQALFWNLTLHEQNTDDKEYFCKDMPSKHIEPVVLEVKGLPHGRYIMELYRVGYGSNDVYTEYIKMGSPNSLNSHQIQELQDRNSGKPYLVETIEISNNEKFSYKIDMRENDVCFVKLKMI